MLKAYNSFIFEMTRDDVLFFMKYGSTLFIINELFLLMYLFPDIARVKFNNRYTTPEKHYLEYLRIFGKSYFDVQEENKE